MLVKDLTTQIQTLKNNFADYKAHLYQDILGSLVRVLARACVTQPCDPALRVVRRAQGGDGEDA